VRKTRTTIAAGHSGCSATPADTAVFTECLSVTGLSLIVTVPVDGPPGFPSEQARATGPALLPDGQLPSWVIDGREDAMRRGSWFVLAATLVALAGCSSGVAGTPQASAAAGNLAQALAVVPAAAGSAMAVDQAAMKQRWGVVEVNSSTDPSSDSYAEYLHHLLGYVAVSGLAEYAATMPEDYGWGWADVDWAVDISGPDAPPARVYRLRDDLDMAVVTASMDEHYERSGPDTRPTYKVDLAKAGSSVPFVGGAVVLPDKRLVVDGASPAEVLAVIEGTAEDLGSTDTGKAMLAAAPGAESLIVGWGASACQNPKGGIRPGTAEPTTAALGSVTWWVSGTVDETHALAGAGYPDASASTADVPRRTELVTNGTSQVTGQPYAKILGATTVTATGTELGYRMNAMQRAGHVVTLWAQRDAPWAFCGSA